MGDQTKPTLSKEKRILAFNGRGMYIFKTFAKYKRV